MASNTTTSMEYRAIRPSAHPPSLIDPLNFCPRKVRGENLPIILSRSGPPDRPPLTHAHGVSRSGTGGHEARHLAVHLGDRQLECGALEHAVGLGSQYRSDLRTGNANGAPREPDTQFTETTPARSAE